MNFASFNYAVGRVRALETKLLSSGDVERMLSAKDADDAYRIFSDFDFGNSLGEAKKSADFQRVVNSELSATKNLLTSIVGFEVVWVLEILWLRYDFHNLKVALKSRILDWDNEKTQEMLLDLGSIPANIMLDFGRNNIPHKSIGERFTRALAKAEASYEKTHDLRFLEYTLDCDLHHLKVSLAHKARNAFLLEFVQKEVDLYNLISYFRLKQASHNLDFADIYAHGGSFELAFFRQEENKILEHLARSHYKNIALAYELFRKENGDFALIEREGDDLLLAHMKRSKHTAFGPEPIFAYYWAKKNNARIVRTVMVSKLAGLPQEKIRKRLRRLYSD